MKSKGHKRDRAFAYGSVLQALSQGLYPDKKHVIRELVQNAYDGLSALKIKQPEEKLKAVHVKVEDSSIFVGDFGIGMIEQRMREYRYLGFSEKIVGQDAGFRGIGKFSPVSLCKRIIVDSSPVGLAQRFRVLIDAEGMMERIKKDRNPPLETLLREHTSLERAVAPKKDHYTFVELQGVRNDAKTYLDVDALKTYLSQTAPLSLNPRFKHAETIEKRLRQYISGHLSIDLTVNKEPIFKNFIEPCGAPRDTLVWNAAGDRLLAYAWSCANEKPGIFDAGDDTPSSDRRHPDAGLVFKVKNISVGDRFLPRRTFWKSSPELSFHFFGEIHVVDANVVPSSDRNDFEDNSAREELYSQCSVIARDLNLVRRTESTERNFEKAVEAVNTVVASEEGRLATSSLPVELRDEAKYNVRSTVEGLKKRLAKSKNPKQRRAAQAAVKRGEKLLVKLDSPGTQAHGFVDIAEALQFDDRCRALYSTIINVLRDEFRFDRKRLEKLIERIHKALKTSHV